VRVRTDDGLEGVGEADASPEVIKAIIDAPYSHTSACGLREILIGENRSRTRTALAEDVPPHHVFRPQLSDHLRDERHDMAFGTSQENTSTSPSIFCSAANSTSAFRPLRFLLFWGGTANTPDEIGQRWSRPVIGLSSSVGTDGAKRALDVELVRGARAGVGDDATLLIDPAVCGCADGPEPRPQAFAQSNIGWLEEPLRPGDVDGYAWLRDRFARADRGRRTGMRTRVVPALNRSPRPGRLSRWTFPRNGFTDARLYRARVEEIGARLCNHCYTSPITVAASLHWLATCGTPSSLRIASMIRPCATEMITKTPGQRRLWIARTGPTRPGITFERGIHQAVSGRRSPEDGKTPSSKHQTPKNLQSNQTQYLGPVARFVCVFVFLGAFASWPPSLCRPG